MTRAALARWWAWAAVALVLAAGLAAVAASGGDGAGPPSPPGQPASGPGGADYPHAGVRVTAGGAGADAWFAFEPADPAPASAPVAVVTHGYFEYSGYEGLEALVRHTARTGTIVVYPRWQTSVASPCPGPFDIEPCIRSEVAGIKGALRHLATAPGHVRPRAGRASYFGFSFGGIITANVANRWRELGVPRPTAIFLEDPHDGGLAGRAERSLDDSLDGIPATARIVCHSSADGVISEEGNAGSSCNAVVPRLGHVPAANRSLVMVGRDDHGDPPLGAGHGVCAGGGPFHVDAYDWRFCWRVWDALRACADTGEGCDRALGDGPRNRYVGTWSDGTPIAGVTVRAEAPLRPDDVPERVPAPAGLTAVP